jgi:5-methylcytosine-specific restriction endonuclease McrA
MSANILNILNKPIVLSLNRAWQIIGHRTVKQALTSLAGGDSDTPPAFGLDIGYARLPDGTYDFDSPTYMNPVSWDEWIKLPVRDFDLEIRTPKTGIRVPTVMVAAHYAKMPHTRARLSRQAIFERDRGICQYTGELVGFHNGNLDHVIPRHRGGRDSFENLVWCKRSLNSRKANHLPDEVGLKLLRRPKAPPALPFSATIRVSNHRDWKHVIHAPPS